MKVLAKLAKIIIDSLGRGVWIMRVLLLSFLCYVATGGTQQAIPRLGDMQACCSLLPDGDILQCFNESVFTYGGAHSEEGTAKVALVNFASPGSGSFSVKDIGEFSTFHIAILSMFARHRGYEYRSYRSDSQPLGEDFRWYKIKLMSEALDPVHGWAKNADYLVWIDADAIVMDFELSIEDIGNQHPEAHLIASADVKMGLMNSVRKHGSLYLHAVQSFSLAPNSHLTLSISPRPIHAGVLYCS